MSREIPKELYDHTMRLVTAIAQPKRGAEPEDREIADTAMADLKTLFIEREHAAQSDPFLTETLADFTDDTGEAIRLYRLALEQSAATPGEPTHTKHLGLAQRLQAAGEIEAAHEQLKLGRSTAFSAGDKEYMKDMDDLLAKLQSNKGLDRAREG